MDLNRIEQLLEKYWECETTLEEEKELKTFFKGSDVPEHLKSYVPMFQYYTEEKRSGQLNDVFDKDLVAKIKGLNQGNGQSQSRVVKLFYDMGKVAAVILVVITAGYFVKQEYMEKKDSGKPYLSDTFEDPQKAFEETKKALKMISTNFNKGRKEVRKLGTFHDAQQKARDIDKAEKEL